MAGENPDDPRSGADDEFLSKTKWQRFQVLIMGPVMNILLAIVRHGDRADAGRGSPGVRRPARGRRQRVAPGRRQRRRASMPGDRITEAGGRDTPTWEDFFMAVGTRANRAVPIDVAARGPRTDR